MSVNWNAAYQEALIEHGVLRVKLDELEAVIDYYRRKMDEKG